MRPNRERFWRDRQPCLKEGNDAQACVRPTIVLFIFAMHISFQSIAIFPCLQGTTQISHGTRTKCRKTRAMLSDFSTVACLALRQLRHFYGTRCSFAKIAIPYTIYPSLNLLEFYVCINYAMTRKNIAFSFISIKTQKSSYNRQIFAQIKLQKNIDSFKKKQYHYC